MRIKEQKTHDGFRLRTACSDSNDVLPWLLLIMPFGLRLELAEPFIDYNQSRFNVVTWESRLILDGLHDGEVDEELALACHVDDLFTVTKMFGIERAAIVGYCSGAGVALKAIALQPQLPECLILAHGEYTLLQQPDCTTQFASDIDNILSISATNENFAQKVFEKLKNDRVEEEEDLPDGLDMPYTEYKFFRRFAKNYIHYKSTNYSELAEEVSHPTLLITGNRDKQASVSSTQFIANRIPDASVIVDPDADHYGLLRPNSRTMEIAQEFLSNYYE